MLYLAKVQDTEGKEIKLVLLSRVSTDGGVMHFNIKSLLGNEKVAPYISNYGDRIKIHASFDEQQFPFIVPIVSEDLTGIDTYDITPIYKFMSSGDAAAVEASKIVSAVKNPDKFNVKEVEEIRESIEFLTGITKGEGAIKVVVPEVFYSDVVKVSKAVVENNRKLGHVFQSFTSDINETAFMESPTDDFFIQLPTYERLRSNEIAIQALLPKWKDIGAIYPHPIYRTPYVLNYFEKSQAVRKELMDKLGREIKLTPEERVSVDSLPMKYVVGDPRNNDLDIQSNEEGFRAAFAEYIRYDISQTYPDRDIEECYKGLISSKRMFLFIETLLTSMVAMNWSHTNKLPIGYAADADEDDDEGVEESGWENKTFRNMGDDIIDDALGFLTKFVDDAARAGGMGFDAYIEAIIKIARWGERKISVLRLNNFPEFFDMNTFYIRSTSGNIGNMSPVLVEGYQLGPNSFIMFEDKFQDVDFRNKVGFNIASFSLPVGITAIRMFEGDESQLVNMSMIDIIGFYRKDPNCKLLYGIDLVNGQFVQTLPMSPIKDTRNLTRVVSEVQADVDMLTVYENSPGIKDLRVLTGTPVNTLESLKESLYSTTLTKWADHLLIRSKDEIATKVATTPFQPANIISFNLSYTVVPIILCAALEFDEVFTGEFDLAQILNMYLKAADKLGFNVEGQFLKELGSDVVDNEPRNVGMTGAANVLNNMTAFGGKIATTEARVETPGNTTEGPVAQENTEGQTQVNPSQYGKPDVAGQSESAKIGASYTPVNPNPIPQAVVGSMELGGTAVINEYVTEAVRNHFFKEVPPTAPRSPVAHNGQIIGYFVGEKAGNAVTYTMTKDPGPASDTPAPSTPLLMFMIQIYDSFAKLVAGNANAARIRFENEETLLYYQEVLKKAVTGK